MKHRGELYLITGNMHMKVAAQLKPSHYSQKTENSGLHDLAQ